MECLNCIREFYIDTRSRALLNRTISSSLTLIDQTKAIAVETSLYVTLDLCHEAAFTMLSDLAAWVCRKSAVYELPSGRERYLRRRNKSSELCGSGQSVKGKLKRDRRLRTRAHTNAACFLFIAAAFSIKLLAAKLRYFCLALFFALPKLRYFISSYDG